MDILERILTLRQAGERFAIATVVSRQAPVSSRIGDKAIILESGVLEGFIGGACSRDIIKEQAILTLESARPRLVRINPEPNLAAPVGDEICVPMTCASEGALDVYIEPQLSKAPMLVVGGSPIALALAQQGQLQGYEVTLVCEPEERAATETGLLRGLEVLALAEFKDWLASLSPTRLQASIAVVASMGHYDEESLAALVDTQPHYLGLVASKKRGQTVIDMVKEMHVDAENLSLVRSPAGLDIGAKTPHEVAISILAEVIQLRKQGQPQPNVEKQEAIDPVCGMIVLVETAKHSAKHDGTMYYFCCPNCRRRFLKEPDAYLTAEVET